jgi:hypothetical protein
MAGGISTPCRCRNFRSDAKGSLLARGEKLLSVSLETGSVWRLRPLPARTRILTLSEIRGRLSWRPRHRLQYPEGGSWPLSRSVASF